MFFKDNRDNRDNFLGCKIFVSIVSIVFKHHQQAWPCCCLKHHQQAWPCCCLKIINKLGLAVVLKTSAALAILSFRFPASLPLRWV